ncbi:hypothetical protein PG996_002360 [Apiospora saccharicola]|uniref:Uncharacterized protein n=1 Tax=Apiospora saccharicola TaxID=335842 RepID=A0ABR1WJA8_9PEZI
MYSQPSDYYRSSNKFPSSLPKIPYVSSSMSGHSLSLRIHFPQVQQRRQQASTAPVPPSSNHQSSSVATTPAVSYTPLTTTTTTTTTTAEERVVFVFCMVCCRMTETMSRLAVVYVLLHVGAEKSSSTRPPTRLHMRITGSSRPDIAIAWHKIDK